MKVKVGDNEVNLDPKNLDVDEVNMNEFLKEFAGTYNHYATQWATAQYIQRSAEDRYDITYAERFRFYKENDGGSDKLVEAKVKVHDAVVEAKRKVQQSKYVTTLLNSYLRSLDKAYESALNLGYNIRKEMDKLYPKSVSEFPKNVDEEVAKVCAAE